MQYENGIPVDGLMVPQDRKVRSVSTMINPLRHLRFSVWMDSARERGQCQYFQGKAGAKVKRRLDPFYLLTIGGYNLVSRFVEVLQIDFD